MVHEFNALHYTRVGDTDLDFRVSIGRHGRPVSDRVVARVDIALRGVTCPVHGSDLRVSLLSDTFAAFNKLTSNLDCVFLPSITWCGSTSVLKTELFELEDMTPNYLCIELFGSRELFELFEGPIEGAIPGEDREDQSIPVRAPSDADEGVAPVGTPTAPGAPPPPKCCPNVFTTPNGNLPTTIVNIPPAAPGGAVANVNVECQPWVINATFKAAPPPCQCACCEYRQFVKGTLTVTAPGGVAMNGTPITDYRPPPAPAPGAAAPAPGAPPPAPIPVHGINAANFIEDTVGDANRPRNPQGYGHRNDLALRPEMKRIAQDYPGGCSYWGMDFPQGAVPKGTTMAINLTFKGEIWDTCNNNAVLLSNQWTWIFNGVV